MVPSELHKVFQPWPRQERSGREDPSLGASPRDLLVRVRLIDHGRPCSSHLRSKVRVLHRSRRCPVDSSKLAWKTQRGLQTYRRVHTFINGALEFDTAIELIKWREPPHIGF